MKVRAFSAKKFKSRTNSRLISIYLEDWNEVVNLYSDN